MATLIGTKASSLLAQLIGHLRNPLYRNGYALASSAVLTAGIGMVYWVLAARLYPPDLVGLNSAIISAMMFLGGVAQLNLSNANIRFIPTAGRATPRLVGTTYAVSLVVAAIVSLVFLSQLRLFAPSLSFLGSSTFMIAFFTIATMAWAIFALEDGVLTGLRQAPFVPVENTAYSLVKVALMIELIHILPQLGLFASWVIGLIIIVIPTTYFIFKRLIPLHMREAREQEAPLVIKQLTGYIAGDYLGATAWLACTSLMPLLVTQLAGATANAYYYLSWQIALLLYAITKSLGASMVVEASARPQRLGHFTSRIILQSLTIIAPLIVVLGLGAPLVLRLFGKTYAAEGTTLLRILLLSAIPYIIISADVSVARVQRQISRVVIVLVSLCALVLGLSAWWLPRLGVLGAGYAWLGSETVIAAAIILSRLPVIRDYLTSHGEAGTALVQIGPLKVFDPAARSHPALTQLTHPWRVVENWRRLKKAEPFVPALLRQVPPQAGRPSPSTWRLKYLIQTQTDRTVAALGPPAGPALVLAKLPGSPEAASGLWREAEVLTQLNSLETLGAWRNLLPAPMAQGRIGEQPFTLEPLLPGKDARLMLERPEEAAWVLDAAAEAIAQLHQGTRVVRVMDGTDWNNQAAVPLEILCQTLEALPGGRRYLEAATRLGQELKESLAGQTLATSWVHGDFVPANLLVDPQAREVTGILDWELAKPDGLPVLDILQLIMTTRREVQGKELGALVVDLLRDPTGWSPQERLLLEKAGVGRPGEALGPRPLLLLFWLQHVAANLSKSASYRRHLWWVFANIRPVLQCLQ